MSEAFGDTSFRTTPLGFIVTAILGEGENAFFAVESKISETLREIIAANEALLAEEAEAVRVAISPAVSPAVPLFERLGETVESLGSEAQALFEDLAGFLDFITPQSLSLEGLLEKLSGLLLQPSRIPGEPCLAPAPLLRDLLDITLGKLTGGIGEMIARVSGSVEDRLFPAFAQEGDLTHFVQAVLADPVTAALNLILGQRGQIDCEVEAGLGVGERVMETQIHHLEEVLTEALA